MSITNGSLGSCTSGVLTVGSLTALDHEGKYFLWTINKFQQRDGTIRSHRFVTSSCAGSAKWRLQMKTNFSKEGKQYISLFLELVGKPLLGEYLVNCAISLIAKVNNIESKTRHFENYKFTKIGKNYGYPCFAPRQDVLERYVKDDILSIRITMDVRQSQTSCLLHEDLGVLLEHQQYGDWTLKGSYSNMKQISIDDNVAHKTKPQFPLKCEGKELKVYKGLLAASSPYFARYEKINEDIDIKDMDYDSLYRSIHYIYTRVVPEGSSVKKLLPVADKLKIDGLRQHCITQLLADVRVHDACEVLILADQYSLPDLKQRCKELILRHPESMQMTDGWKLLDQYPGLLKETLLAVGSLRVNDRSS